MEEECELPPSAATRVGWVLSQIVTAPAYWSANLFYRLFGDDDASIENGRWEERLHYGCFFGGLPAIGGAAIAVFIGMLVWHTGGSVERTYADYGASALRRSDFVNTRCERMRIIWTSSTYWSIGLPRECW